MFNLTEAELQNAFEAISHHGYSAMLPPPDEWRSVIDKWPDVRAYLAQLDLDIYEPYKPMRVFAPKSRATIRILHLLHPEDLLIYTALVLIVKDDIEKERIPRRSRRVFSYRIDASAPNRLYNTRGAHDAYLAQLEKKAAKPTTKFVGIADIADFYPRSIFNTLIQIKLLHQSVSGRAFGVGTTFSGFDVALVGWCWRAGRRRLA